MKQTNLTIEEMYAICLQEKAKQEISRISDSANELLQAIRNNIEEFIENAEGEYLSKEAMIEDLKLCWAEIITNGSVGKKFNDYVDEVTA